MSVARFIGQLSVPVFYYTSLWCRLSEPCCPTYFLLAAAYMTTASVLQMLLFRSDSVDTSERIFMKL